MKIRPKTYTVFGISDIVSTEGFIICIKDLLERKGWIVGGYDHMLIYDDVLYLFRYTSDNVYPNTFVIKSGKGIEYLMSNRPLKQGGETGVYWIPAFNAMNRIGYRARCEIRKQMIKIGNGHKRTAADMGIDVHEIK
jgi:hypothetical protein